MGNKKWSFLQSPRFIFETKTWPFWRARGKNVSIVIWNNNSLWNQKMEPDTETAGRVMNRKKCPLDTRQFHRFKWNELDKPYRLFFFLSIFFLFLLILCGRRERMSAFYVMCVLTADKTKYTHENKHNKNNNNKKLS